MAFLLYGSATSRVAATGLFPSSTTSSSHPSKSINPFFRTTRSLNFSPLKVAAPPTQPLISDQSEEREDEDEGVAVDDEKTSSSSKFSWRDHWYPVSLIEDLDPDRPTPFQLLGRDIVLWKDKLTAEWVAFDDKCPHRLAPLSVSFFY